MKIVLIGMSGVGKTTVGKQLAAKHNMDFFDTDKLIEENTKQSILELFAKGESFFRKCEHQAILQLQEKVKKLKSYVISTGGGSVIGEKNIATLKLLGKIFFLNEAACCSYKKLLKNISSKPLYANSNYKHFEEVYNQRLPIYRSIANVELDVTNKSTKYIVNLIETYKKGE